jgi:hypothetical protein
MKKFLNITYAIFTAFALLAAFGALFARQAGFSIPLITGGIVSYLDRFAIRVNTIQGPATVMRGEHWFFLIILGIVLFLGIVLVVLHNTLLKK